MARFALSIAALLIAASPLAAQDGALTPIPLDAAQLDIEGVWSYRTADHTNTGPCPAVPEKRGELSITMSEDLPVRVDVLSGELCGRPMHLFSGDIEWGNLVVGNAAAVDDEGGQAFNSITVFFYSDTQGSGVVRSQYVHPGGMSCGWTYRVELSRD